MNQKLPMLAENLKIDDTRKLFRILDSKDWTVQQKLDGQRLMVHLDEGVARGYNRKGSLTPLNDNILNVFKNVSGCWLFDGEYFDNVFWVFDIVESPLHNSKLPLSNRIVVLDKFFTYIDVSSVKKLSYHTQNKGSFVKSCVAADAEGVIFKNLNSTYQFGKRSSNMLKYKFVQTTDVFVTETKRKDKEQAISIGQYHEGRIVDSGGLKIPLDLVDQIQKGDILEVRYLYATKSNKLYQPIFHRLRKDKDASDCTTADLKYAGSVVIK
jgi:bifunctional non-homologous end joining protein LigD